jgi:hypothetical protein
MTRRSFVDHACGAIGLLATGQRLLAADKYAGPRPKKKDVLYLVHADNLIETETVTAEQSTGKDGQVFGVPGAASPVRTPLAEPIFLLATEEITPDSLGLYQFDVRNGRREIVITGKKRKSSNKQFHLSVRNLERGLYRIEASEPLDPGEYSISPEGSNTAFCFSVY